MHALDSGRLPRVLMPILNKFNQYLAVVLVLMLYTITVSLSTCNDLIYLKNIDLDHAHL